MSASHLVLGIGELLWDIFPATPHSGCEPKESSSTLAHMGGAPANFAVMAGRLGNHAAILSRIGRDPLGRKAVEQLKGLPADETFLQVDPVHETGRVMVEFHSGQPHYTIRQPAAWDFLELTDEWVKLAERAQAICFGTLAQRSPESRHTIQTLAAESSSSCIRVFDVNLRAPFYSSETVQESLEVATVLKMNDAELPLVLKLLGLSDDPVGDEAGTEDGLRLGAQRLLAEFPALMLVAVTRGAHGSLLVNRQGWHSHPGIPVEVKDTIGAGDAFTAAMTHYLLQGANLARINEAGNRWGAWVASHPGAMPPLTNEVRNRIAAAIEI